MVLNPMPNDPVRVKILKQLTGECYVRWDVLQELGATPKHIEVLAKEHLIQIGHAGGHIHGWWVYDARNTQAWPCILADLEDPRGFVGWCYQGPLIRLSHKGRVRKLRLFAFSLEGKKNNVVLVCRSCFAIVKKRFHILDSDSLQEFVETAPDECPKCGLQEYGP